MLDTLSTGPPAALQIQSEHNITNCSLTKLEYKGTLNSFILNSMPLNSPNILLALGLPCHTEDTLLNMHGIHQNYQMFFHKLSWHASILWNCFLEPKYTNLVLSINIKSGLIQLDLGHCSILWRPFEILFLSYRTLTFTLGFNLVSIPSMF